MKYLKVMFENTSGANNNLKYKIDEVNVAPNWNPNAKNGKEMGGFNFSTEDKILRWLHRGDTLYDVIVPKNAEIVNVIDSATPGGVLRTNKIIVTNPRKVTDEMALHFYEISTIPETAYPKALGAVSVRNYYKTANKILKDKVTPENIDFYLSEWNDFIDKSNRKDSNTTVKHIDKALNEIYNKKTIQ